MSNPYNRVGKLRPKRNKFDLSYRNLFSCDMGQLIPVALYDCIPGDFFKIGNQVTVRFQPLAAPIMHEMSASVHYFFVPYRLLWDKFEEFISQGEIDSPSLLMPIVSGNWANARFDRGNLWDYFGFPVENLGDNTFSESSRPIRAPFEAYYFIYNEYYRDQNLQSELDWKTTWYGHILNRNWRKDYFTAALPYRQKGTAPALPVDTTLSWTLGNPLSPASIPLMLSSGVNPSQGMPPVVAERITLDGVYSGGGSATVPYSNHFSPFAGQVVDPQAGIVPFILTEGLKASSTSFDVADLRLAFQTQKWLERNARAGTRYTEFLQAHFSVSPSDSRLQRPEYIGGTKVPIVVSEVLQTSQTTEGPDGSPQAAMAGHGLAADSQFAGTYNVQEYGIIMGIFSCMPKVSYSGQGFPREWLKRTPLDFYFPEFAHLSEQEVKYGEIYARVNDEYDKQIFGYMGQYDEYRSKQDVITSEMRRTGFNPLNPAEGMNLSYWHLGRYFSTRPNLNSEFITCTPRKDIFSVTNVPGLIVNVDNRVHAIRPLPLVAEPGLVDHF